MYGEPKWREVGVDVRPEYLRALSIHRKVLCSGLSSYPCKKIG